LDCPRESPEKEMRWESPATGYRSELLLKDFRLGFPDWESQKAYLVMETHWESLEKDLQMAYLHSEILTGFRHLAIQMEYLQKGYPMV
jgi:hypothetical protein